jgi:hypothetical protein
MEAVNVALMVVFLSLFLELFEKGVAP